MNANIRALNGFVRIAAPTWGGETGAGDRPRSTGAPAPALAPDPQQVMIQQLSRDLGVPAATLRAQQARTKLGWGDLLIANRLAQKTGLAFDRVVSELEQGALFHIVWAALAARRLGGLWRSAVVPPGPRIRKGGTI